ncbi:unnamed protein product [Symbiodinium sp. CCMP2592]|nr:unnamed protein product [Symbiodinium sp. CCMP2592]
MPKAVEPRAVAIPAARQATSDGPQSMHAPLKPSEKRGATAPRPNRCWASGAQPTDVPSVTGHGDPEVAERGAASARGSTGRKPLPPPSGALRDSGHLEPPGSKGSKSRPTSAQGQVDGHGTQGSEKTRATSVLPASGRHPLPAGAAAAAVAAMEAINGGEAQTLPGVAVMGEFVSDKHVSPLSCECGHPAPQALFVINLPFLAFSDQKPETTGQHSGSAYASFRDAGFRIGSGAGVADKVPIDSILALYRGGA